MELAFSFYPGANIKDKTKLELIENNKGDYEDYHLLLLGIYHQHPEFRELFQDLNLKILTFYEKLIKEGIEKKEIKEDINIEETSVHIFTVFMGFVELSIVFPKYSLETLLDINLKLIWHNLKIPEK